MLKLNPVRYALVVLLIASLACTVPAVSTPDPSFLGTMVAQTIVMQLTQTAQSLPSATLTLTPELPTITPTLTLSPTPTFTATPLIPQLRVSVATNCRLGPGDQYERVGVLSVDEVVEVFGRDPTLKFWYIRNPDAVPEYCWVWGEYAELAGNTIALSVFTPPPVFTFGISSGDVRRCNATGWWVDLLLKNPSTATFKSFTIIAKDEVTHTVVSMSADGFTNKNGCSESIFKPTLDPKGLRTISLLPFTYDPSGHGFTATITLCTEVGLGGTCGSQVITFTP